MAALRDLTARLRLDTTAFAKGLGRVQAQLRQVSRSLAVGAAGLGYAVKRTVDSADEMGKAAQKFGVPVDQLSRLAYAAEQSDVSLDTLGTNLNRLSVKMVAARDGNKAAVQAFTDLGVSVTDADGKLRSVEDVFQDVAEATRGMNDGAEKNAMMQRLFGKGFADLIPLLNEGREGLKAWAKEADDLGITILPATAEAAGEFNDSLNTLGAAGRGLLLQVIAALAPAMEAVANAAVALATAFGELDPMIKAVAGGAAALLVTLPFVGLAFLGVGAALKGVLATLALIFTPWGLITIAAIGAATAIWYNWEWLKENLSQFGAYLKTTAVEAWESLKQAGADAADWITSKIDGMITSIKNAITYVTDLAKKFKEAITLSESDHLQREQNGFKEDFGVGGGGGGGGGGAAGALTAGNSMGLALVNGMVIGAAQGVTQWQGALANTFGMVAQVARDVLGISSPSTVFKGIGRWIMEGLGLGIREGRAGPVQEMQSATAELDTGVNGLTERMGEFKSAAEQAFVSFVTGTQSLRQALSQLAASMAQTLAKRAFSSLLSAFGFANGGVFSGGSVTPFASGGVVSGATLFPMTNGLGLMGEAGPEAIMPLTRIGGKLGVRAQGGGSAVAVSIGFDESVGGLTAMARNEAGRVVAMATPQIVRQSVGAVYAANRERPLR
jgi:hypothetical protein